MQACQNIVLVPILILCIGPLHAQVEWRRTYGGYASDDAHNVIETSVPGYLITGTTGSFGMGASDIYVIRIDELGLPIWSKTFGGLGVESGVAGGEFMDGFMLCGSTSIGSSGGYDFFLVRIGADGALVWEDSFGTTDWDLCHAMSTDDSSVLAAGITYGNGNTEGRGHIIKVNAQGEQQWVYTDSVAGPSEFRGIQTVDNMTFAVGSKLVNGSKQAMITALDNNGDEIWRNYFGGAQDDWFNSVIVNDVGEIIAAGATRSLSEFERIYIVKVTNEGDEVWQRDIGAATADAAATAIKQDHESGYILTGYNTLNLGEYDMIITSITEDGWFEWGDNYGVGNPAVGKSLQPTNDGGYIIAGWSEGHGPGIRAMYVVKTNAEGSTSSDVIPYLDPVSIPIHSNSNLSINPNPTSAGSTLNITSSQMNRVRYISLFDPNGREIIQQICRPYEGFRLPPISDGLYYLWIENEDGSRSVHPLIIN